MVVCSKCGSNLIHFLIYDVVSDATSDDAYALNIICSECGESSIRILPPPPKKDASILVNSLMELVKIQVRNNEVNDAQENHTLDM